MPEKPDLYSQFGTNAGAVEDMKNQAKRVWDEHGKKMAAFKNAAAALRNPEKELAEEHSSNGMFRKTTGREEGQVRYCLVPKLRPEAEQVGTHYSIQMQILLFNFLFAKFLYCY